MRAISNYGLTDGVLPHPQTSGLLLFLLLPTDKWPLSATLTSLKESMFAQTAEIVPSQTRAFARQVGSVLIVELLFVHKDITFQTGTTLATQAKERTGAARGQ